MDGVDTALMVMDLLAGWVIGFYCGSEWHAGLTTNRSKAKADVRNEVNQRSNAKR